jgi:hypothetical protein
MEVTADQLTAKLKEKLEATDVVGLCPLAVTYSAAHGGNNVFTYKGFGHFSRHQDSWLSCSRIA